MKLNGLFKRTIKVDFLVRAAILVSIAIISIGSYNYFAGKNAALESAKGSIQKLNSLFISSAVNFISNSRSIPQNSSMIIQSTDITEEKLKSIRRYMFNLLGTTSFATSVMFILENGYFFTLDKILDVKDKKQTDFIENVRYILHVVDERISTSPTKKWYYYDKNHKLIFEKEDKSPSFDFRSYKWYQRALEKKKTSWSNIHPLHRSNAPGLTISTPIYDSEDQIIGVFSVDTSVREFASFINEMRITDSTHAYLIDNDSKIIADSDMMETISIKDSKVSILSAEDLGDVVLSTALDTAKKSNQKSSSILTGDIFPFTVNGVSYIGSLTDFPSKIGLDWSVISITPATTFSNFILNIQKNSLYLAFIILLVALIIAYFQAQNFSGPITELAVEANKIKELDLEDSIFSQTNILEISELSTAMNDLKKNLNNISKYVPKALARKFMDTGQDVYLGGETQEITILFSDVANFTTVSETIPPKALMLHLSDYFEELTKILLSDRGTIDKFIGDAIMAFWGAPTPDKNQALNACHAALLCQQKLRTLNKFWRSVKRPPLVTRMGIHNGSAVVGNVGSSERMNYTAIGDCVNLASRLESINKFYGTHIIISEVVHKKLPSTFITRPIDIVAVKGKKESTKIYELAGMIDDPRVQSLSQQHQTFCKLFTQGFDLYINKEWAEAKELFNNLKHENLSTYKYDDHLVAEYIKRCDELLKHPPKDDWDGIQHLDKK